MKNQLIAITGGIGSGKSTASKILIDLGYKVFSSDQIVRALYKKRGVRKQLKELFPTAVKGLCLKIDRAEISRIVFNDKDMLDRLTKLITPMVLVEILSLYKKSGGVCFAEVPLLFECNYQEEFDGVLIISRPLEDRIESVKTRSNLTREQILSRINSQFDYENSDLSSYSVISNDGDKDCLKQKLLDYLKSI